MQVTFPTNLHEFLHKCQKLYFYSHTNCYISRFIYIMMLYDIKFAFLQIPYFVQIQVIPSNKLNVCMSCPLFMLFVNCAIFFLCILRKTRVILTVLQYVNRTIFPNNFFVHIYFGRKIIDTEKVVSLIGLTMLN